LGNLRLVNVWDIDAWMAGKYRFSKLGAEEKNVFN
jgi:hypothetical protein